MHVYKYDYFRMNSDMVLYQKISMLLTLACLWFYAPLMWQDLICCFQGGLVQEECQLCASERTAPHDSTNTLVDKVCSLEVAQRGTQHHDH